MPTAPNADPQASTPPTPAKESGSLVTYEGGQGSTPSTGFVVIDGVEFRNGVPTKASADLVKEINEGNSERLKGFKFSVSGSGE